MKPRSRTRLTALDEAQLFDGDRLAELLLAGGTSAGEEGDLTALARDIYRAQLGEAQANKTKGDAPQAQQAWEGGLCQWIEGDPSWDDACKCGAPALPEKSWCREHHTRVHHSADFSREALIPSWEADWGLVLQEDLP